MGNALKSLLSELEAGRDQLVTVALLRESAHHVVHTPIDLHTCHELRALSEVFGCEPQQLASALLVASLQDLHECLDDDLALLALEARRAIGESGSCS
ncbi:hypothetical protein [Paludibacterium yongneupense]|uniref:hypothetical protein n=1 Tax=Paludibacterium yongneupense TaxID=400061 RepID=UPI0004181E82|nr:hypothetical protein [Paludibacterium yongneupense]